MSLYIKKKHSKTPGCRHQKIFFKNLQKTRYTIKYFTKYRHSSNGRNSLGHITKFKKGKLLKAHKLSLNLSILPNYFMIVNIFHYTFNNNFLAQILCLTSKNFYYTKALNCWNPGILSCCTFNFKIIQQGFRLLIKYIPTNYIISLIAVKKKTQNSQICRSAGTFASILQKNNKLTKILLKSGTTKWINNFCLSSIGIVSNSQFWYSIWGKAGKTFWKGLKPSVCGEAKNPIDHPHGGRTRGGKHPVTPWGKPTLGKKTKKRYMHINEFIYYIFFDFFLSNFLTNFSVLIFFSIIILLYLKKKMYKMQWKIYLIIYKFYSITLLNKKILLQTFNFSIMLFTLLILCNFFSMFNSNIIIFNKTSYTFAITSIIFILIFFFYFFILKNLLILAYYPSDINWNLIIMFVPLEFFLFWIKPISIAFRLISNLIAGHILILNLIVLLLVFLKKIELLNILVNMNLILAFLIMEVLVIILQTYIYIYLLINNMNEMLQTTYKI